MFAALLLDFFGTLVDEDDEAIASVVAQIADRSPLRPAPRDVSAVWDAAFSALCADAHGARFRKQRELEVESLRRVLARFESPLDADLLSRELFAFWERPRAKPDAERFLRELELPVCVVSNIDAADLARAIASLGWSFERVVTSESCRAYKPRPEPFRAGLAALGRRAPEGLHVGDSIGSDVRGASAAGLAVAWLNPRRRALPEGVPAPRHVAGTLEELALWLRG